MHSKIPQQKLPMEKKSFFLTIVLVLVLSVALAAKTGIGNYALDDAYIVEHSVQGIIDGNESRFIDSTPWDGVTSPAYVGVVALLSLLAPIKFSHWVASTVFTLLLASGWHFICIKKGLGSALTITIVLVSLLVGLTYYQLTNGLETGMAMAAFTWSLIALDHDRPPDWGYALAGVQCFIRPELAALSAIFLIYIAAKRPVGWIRGSFVAILFFIIASAALYFYSGHLMPNTLSAKMYFFAEGCRPDAFKSAFVISALLTFFGGLGLFSFGFAMAAASKLRLVVFSFFAILIFTYFKTFPGALFHNHSRYLYILTPIALIGWAECLSHNLKLVRRCSAGLGIVVLFFLLTSLAQSFRSYVAGVQEVSSDNAEAAEWVSKHVPENAVVMIHDAGKISTTGRQSLVDLVGLKTSYSMEVHRRTTFKECRRIPAAISEIALNARATYMVVTRDWDRIFGLTASLEQTGWSVERADSDRANSIYRVYKISSNSNPASE